ncbi:MAG: hypothetical protein ACQEXJ_08060 [Myxococcota bacterium]
MMRIIAWIAQTLAAITAGIGVGVAVGAASPYAFVVGMGPVLAGLAAAGAVGVVGLIAGTRLGRAALVAAAIGVTTGWVAVQAMEDAHFVDVWTEDFARARLAASGVPAEAPVSDSDLPFYEKGAEAALTKQVYRDTGTSGPVGRWLFRAEGGIRLFGPWEGSRVLPVGRTGAVVWAVLEILLGILVARLVLRRVRAAAVNRRSG